MWPDKGVVWGSAMDLLIIIPSLPPSSPLSSSLPPSTPFPFHPSPPPSVLLPSLGPTPSSPSLPGSEEEALKDLLVTPTPEQHRDYWRVLYHLVLRGQLSDASNLLQRHSRAQTHPIVGHATLAALCDSSSVSMSCDSSGVSSSMS